MQRLLAGLLALALATWPAQSAHKTLLGVGKAPAIAAGGSLTLTHIGVGTDETTYPTSYTKTIAVNANTTTKRIIIAFASANTGAPDRASSVTVGGQALTLLAAPAPAIDARTVEMWTGYFASGAPSGSVSLVVTYASGGYEFIYDGWVIDGAASAQVGSTYSIGNTVYGSPTTIGTTINSTFACLAILGGNIFVPNNLSNLTSSASASGSLNGYLGAHFAQSTTTGSVARGFIPGTQGSETGTLIEACFG